jgi:hypothetical protein
LLGPVSLFETLGDNMGERTRLSYVEVIIIAVILSAVGIAVGPRFTKADMESRLSDLVEGLETMRVQLDLYCAQHNDSFPPCDSFEGFRKAMTGKTGKYGPYVKKIPVNPFNSLRTVRFDGPPAGSGIAGWRFDTHSGLFQADCSRAYAGL